MRRSSPRAQTLRSLTCVDRDIHPSAFISRLYFESHLCSAPITSPHGHTDIGIRVTLGDLGAHLFPTDYVCYSCKRFAMQDARTRRTSLYTVNSSNRITLPHPLPRLKIPLPYCNSVPHASYPLCNKRGRPGPTTHGLVSLPLSCAPESAAPKNRPLRDSSGGKRKRYSRTRATS